MQSRLGYGRRGISNLHAAARDYSIYDYITEAPKQVCTKHSPREILTLERLDCVASEHLLPLYRLLILPSGLIRP